MQQLWIECAREKKPQDRVGIYQSWDSGLGHNLAGNNSVLKGLS